MYFPLDIKLFTEQVVDHFVERSVYNFILCLIA